MYPRRQHSMQNYASKSTITQNRNLRNRNAQPRSDEPISSMTLKREINKPERQLKYMHKKTLNL